ncbi:MAG: DUF6152 family protein [Pseudomonadales bacterium]|nr:DUF6152 family protein [Pseudomonadales bacterium]
MNVPASLSFAFLCLLLPATAVLAHHSGSAFDNSRQIDVSGEVVEWRWSNPHAWLLLNVRNDKGEMELWRIEATSPNILMRSGWNRRSLQPGEQVTVIIRPLRDGKPGGSLLGAVLADGSNLGAPPGSGGPGSVSAGLAEEK